MGSRLRTMTVLLGVLTTILVGWVLHIGAAIVQPLVIAILLASMLQPVVRTAARFKIPAPLTVVVVIVMLFLAIARVGVLLEDNISTFLGHMRDSEHTLDPFFEGQVEAIDELGGWEQIVNGAGKRMREARFPARAVEFALQGLRDIDLEGLTGGLIGEGLGFTKGLFLVLLYMVFIFAEQAVFKRKILAVAGSRPEEAEEMLDTIARGIQRYLGVKTVVSMATGALCYSVLVSLQVPYALLFGFATFALNYIPTFGSIIAGSLATLTALAYSFPLSSVLVVAGTYLAVNIVLGSLVEPRILGRELNLSPLVIIVSVVVWAGIWGVVGTFLAVPLTSAAQIILASHDNTRPIAIMLSSGPPPSERARRWRKSGETGGAGGSAA